jgi:aspartyl-tRNA(Asn)/glutamyl-tRNA(Gln) amidotransferase subunit A
VELTTACLDRVATYNPKLNAFITITCRARSRNPELENTGQFNAYGIPAISVPCGFTAAGLPVGLMIAGPRFSEGRVLALARAYEAATDWHRRRPALTPDTPVPALKRTEKDGAEQE